MTAGVRIGDLLGLLTPLRIAGKLAGFILSRVVAGDAEILSVAIAEWWRGRGIGRRLLDLHLRRLAGLGVRTVFLEVDEDNQPARQLYRKYDFKERRLRRHYYGPGEDAIIMELRFD